MMEKMINKNKLNVHEITYIMYELYNYNFRTCANNIFCVIYLNDF